MVTTADRVNLAADVYNNSGAPVEGRKRCQEPLFVLAA